jgi:hypothetical protein
MLYLWLSPYLWLSLYLSLRFIIGFGLSLASLYLWRRSIIDCALSLAGLGSTRVFERESFYDRLFS